MRRQLTAGFLKLTHPGLWGHVNSMDAHQWVDRDELVGIQSKNLEEILKYAVSNVPRYQEMGRQKGWALEDVVADSLGDFSLTTKSDMVEDRDSFLARGVKREHLIPESTGGSSGVLLRFFYDRRTKEARRATDFFGRTMAGWNPGDPMAVVWGHRGDLSKASGLKARISDVFLYRRITLNAFDMEEQDIEKYLKALELHQPKLLVGYSSSLALLAEYKKNTRSLNIQPRGIISSAETLEPEQRMIIEEQFGCPVFNRYGSREFSNVAQQCDHSGGLHIYSDRAFVEVLRPDGSSCRPGESGELVVTDFLNRVMPFIRYRTGDLGAMSADPCGCGRAYPVLEKVEGRVSEIVVGKNGKIFSCPGPTFWSEGIKGIRQMQLIQESINDLEVVVVPDAFWTDESGTGLEVRMRELLGDIRVTIKLVEEIKPSSSGKFHFTISKVNPFTN